MTLLERFLNYVSFDTQSDPNSSCCPSTQGQTALLEHLAAEMTSIGLNDIETDIHGYVSATVPATAGYEDKPVIGFLAHVDTSPDLSGKEVNPQIIENYDGGDIDLGSGQLLSPADYPELLSFKGHTLITTDGTTLLGADDKAGVAEIMTAMQYLIQHPAIPHGKLRVAFTSDEEIGKGVEHFDVTRFGAQYAYTIDGGMEGEVEYENFNAASAVVNIKGDNIHPGSAKGKMINSITLARQFDSLLPEKERPEHTDNYEGFFHLNNICGTVEQTQMEYIIRDHCRESFERRKEVMNKIARDMNTEIGTERVYVSIMDQYYNMQEIVSRHPLVIEKAVEAVRMAGAKPLIKPIRGGTDGAQLSYKGLPCPNIFTGGMNFHGRYEYCSLNSMHKAVQTIVNLAALWAKVDRTEPASSN